MLDKFTESASVGPQRGLGRLGSLVPDAGDCWQRQCCESVAAYFRVKRGATLANSKNIPRNGSIQAAQRGRPVPSLEKAVDGKRANRILTLHQLRGTPLFIQDGSVKLNTFQDHTLQHSTKICQYEHPVFRLSQSITGNLLSVSVADETEQTLVYAQSEDQHSWVLVSEAE